MGKILSKGTRKGYKKLLVAEGSKVGVNKVPMQKEHDNALGDYTNFDKKIMKLFNLNELVYGNVILLMNTFSNVGNVLKCKKFGIF